MLGNIYLSGQKLMQISFWVCLYLHRSVYGLRAVSRDGRKLNVNFILEKEEENISVSQ